MKAIHITMKPTLKTYAFATMAIFALAAASQAAVLVNYTFLDSNASQTTGVATGSNVTLGSFTGASGPNTPYAGFSASSDTIFIRSDATGNLAADGDTLAEAVANNAYAGFTLTNSTGSTINLETLTYNIWFTASGAAPRFYEIAVLADAAGSFTTGDMLQTETFSVPSGNLPSTAGTQLSINNDISSLGALANGASMQFRLYIIDNVDDTASIYRVDDVTVNGTLIPEPTAALLGSLGLLTLLRRRRN